MPRSGIDPRYDTRLETLREIAAGLKRSAILANAENPATASEMNQAGVYW